MPLQFILSANRQTLRWCFVKEGGLFMRRFMVAPLLHKFREWPSANTYMGYIWSCGARWSSCYQQHATPCFLPPFKLVAVQRSPLLGLDWFFFQHKCSGLQVSVFTCISCVSTRHNCNQCDVRHLFVTILLWMSLMSSIISPLTRVRPCQGGSGSGSDAGADLSFGVSK